MLLQKFVAGYFPVWPASVALSLFIISEFLRNKRLVIALMRAIASLRLSIAALLGIHKQLRTRDTYGSRSMLTQFVDVQQVYL